MHIDDPEYYEILYSRDKPRNKSLHLTGMFGAPASAFAQLIDHFPKHGLQLSNSLLGEEWVHRLSTYPMILYSRDKPRNKSLHLTGMFGAPASAFGSVDHRRQTCSGVCLSFQSRIPLHSLLIIFRSMGSNCRIRCWETRQTWLWSIRWVNHSIIWRTLISHRSGQRRSKQLCSQLPGRCEG
jgi:hypothetical protein